MGDLPRFSDVSDPLEWVVSRVRPGRRSKAVASRWGYRPYMVERYLNILGSWAEVGRLLQSFELSVSPSVRCNTLKVRDCGLLVERLERLGFEVKPIEWAEHCFEVVGGVNMVSTLGATHEFLIGMYYLYRGRASLLPPLTLSPVAGERVCDLAAAPGGKATHMAQLMRNEGVLLACDVSRSRMRALRSNVERLGIRNAVLLRIDGRIVPDIFPSHFDRVLLDAPCSGEGLIMLDPSRKVKTSMRDLVRMHELQVELLNAALDSVRPGGLVLYSTCSIAPEEDEFVIAEVVERREDVRVERVDAPLRLSEGVEEYFGLELPDYVRLCVRVWPHIHGMEGFFMCLLRRVD